MMTYEITTRILKNQPTAACRATLAPDRVGPWLAGSYALIAAYLERMQIAMAGPPYARYTFVDDQMKVEAGFPVARAIRGEGSVQPSQLPGGQAATTVHIGPYEALEDAYKAVMSWLAEHDLAPAGAHWEVYYTDPVQEPDSTKWRTDVIVPYTEAGPADSPGGRE